MMTMDINGLDLYMYDDIEEFKKDLLTYGTKENWNTVIEVYHDRETVDPLFTFGDETIYEGVRAVRVTLTHKNGTYFDTPQRYTYDRNGCFGIGDVTL